MLKQSSLALLAGLAIVAALALPGVGYAAGTTYYVSPSGDDRGPGTSEDRPWRSLGRVNEHPLGPGDSVLLQAGQTFRGALDFDDSNAGRPDAPITIGSYGDGQATIDAGRGTAIYVENAGGYMISNLKIVGAGRERNTGDGISIFNELPGDRKLEFIRIENVDVGGFGNYGVTIGGWNGTSGFRDVRISNVTAHDNGKSGIITYGEEMFANEEVHVERSVAYRNSGLRDLGTNSGNGIVLGSVDGGTIERSLAYDNGWICDSDNGGPVGIWAYNANNITIQYNESYGNRTDGPADGGGFDFDHNVSNSVMQYNYSHDNDGAGFLLAQSPGNDSHTNNVIRYNISENDARKSPRHSGIHIWGGVRNAEIYNNTIYTSALPGGTPRAISIVNTGITNRFASGISVRNNIVVTTGGVPMIAIEASQLAGAKDLLFQGNLYFPSDGPFRVMWGRETLGDLQAWRAAANQERASGRDVGMVADPGLVGPGSGGTIGNVDLLPTLGAYQLRDTSPAVNAGLDLAAEFGIAMPGQDFYQNPVPQQGGFDVGAHELQTPAAQSPPLVDARTDGGSRYQSISKAA